MKEHPILFSGKMVEAILRGRKTITRRIIKPQPIKIEVRDIGEGCQEVIWKDSKRLLSMGGGGNVMQVVINKLCPYGQVGDHLWVRECWAQDMEGEIFWKADHENGMPSTIERWKPSIHLPRSISRIILEITNIRAERLQEITKEDARKEGLQPVVGCTGMINGWYSPKTHMKVLAIDAFCDLWDSINKKKGYGWDINPWVWVISFKRIEV